ncbi:hypothetical protein [Oleiharenicola lentus]|uniref:hypothetical protein n=1 Tax=Oleiharenicola lentus TaxID=2508720 RepID=UPI003F66A935
MSAVLPIIKKDIRRFWPLLSLSVGLSLFAVLRNYHGYSIEFVRDGSSFPDTFLAITMLIFWFFSVLALVQEDAPGSSKSFWLTRPVAPAELFAAKLALALAITTIPVAFAHGYLAWRISESSLLGLQVMTGTGLSAALFVVIAMFFSSVTNSALRTCAVILLCAVAGLFLGAMLPSQLQRELGMSNSNRRLINFASTNFAALAVLGIGLTAVIYLQYRRRDLRRTIPAAVAVLLFALCTKIVWPWSILPIVSTEPILLYSAGDSKVAIQLKGGVGEYRGTPSSTARRLAPHVAGKIQVTTEDRRRSFVVGSATSTLVLPDGEMITLPQQFNRYANINRGLAPWELRKEAPPPGAITVDAEVTLFAAPPDGKIPETLPAGTSLISQLRVLEHERFLFCSLPFRHGAEHRGDGFLVTLDNLAAYGNEARCELRQLRAASWFSNNPSTHPAQRSPQRFTNGLRFVLYNARLDEYAYGRITQSRVMAPIFIEETVYLLKFTDRFSLHAKLDERGLDQAWINEAELMVFGAREGVEFTHTLTVPDFKLLRPVPAGASTNKTN